MQCLFWAACILLLGVSVSQDMQIPCRSIDDCKTSVEILTNENTTCVDGFCLCALANGTAKDCKLLVNSTSTIPATTTDSTLAKDTQRQVTGIVGHVCSLDNDCTRITLESFCNTTRKQCECKTGFFGSDDNLSCISGIRYNETGCTTDKQCLHFEKATTCTDGVCACAANHLRDGDACIEQKDFGASCTMTSECLKVDKAICDQKQCICPVTSVINPNVTACLPIASKVEDECIESIQCTQLLGLGGVCMDQRCRCQRTHHHSTVSFKCVLNRDLGSECQMDYECSNGDENSGFGHMRCSTANRCVCAEGFQDIEGKCEIIESASESAAARYGDVATIVSGLTSLALLLAML